MYGLLPHERHTSLQNITWVLEYVVKRRKRTPDNGI